MTDAEAIAILDNWADKTYLRWQTYRASEDSWYCRLAPAMGQKGARNFTGPTASAARVKAAETVLAAAKSPMPGWRYHVFGEHYGPNARYRVAP